MRTANRTACWLRQERAAALEAGDLAVAQCAHLEQAALNVISGVNGLAAG